MKDNFEKRLQEFENVNWPVPRIVKHYNYIQDNKVCHVVTIESLIVSENVSHVLETEPVEEYKQKTPEQKSEQRKEHNRLVEELCKDMPRSIKFYTPPLI